MNEKIKELESKLAADKEFAAKYKEALESAAAKGAKSDSEVISGAAKAIGFEITPEEIERSAAEAQELSDGDLEVVTGGTEYPEDEYGHEFWCSVAWHCYTAFRHTDSESHDITCWSDYLCVFSENKD